MSNTDRGPATDETNAEINGARARAALDLMKKALQFIDDNDGPDDAGAYLDQAIHRLEDWISACPPRSQ
jgi:hypothetical protein